MKSNLFFTSGRYNNNNNNTEYLEALKTKSTIARTKRAIYTTNKNNLKTFTFYREKTIVEKGKF